MPSGVLDVLWTAVFLVGIALALYCLLTIHRSPYFSEVLKLKWLLFTLALPFLGPEPCASAYSATRASVLQPVVAGNI